MLRLLGIVGELSFIGGIILNLWAFLSPTPWHSNDVTNSMLYFTPYIEPVGYVAPNPCSSSPLSNSSVSIKFGPTNPVNYSNVAVWMGPLGSCSRDEDGAVHCTNPSYSDPQFNMTYVQDNSVFYPQNMPARMAGSAIRGLTIFHCVLLGLYLLVSVSYWFPLATSRIFKADRGDGPASFLTFALVVMIIAAIAEFFVNFGISVDRVWEFNSIDNFYDPAPCGQARKLKSGILLVARKGKMYKMMWTSWCLIYIFAGLFLISRIGWVSSGYTGYVRDEASKRSARDVERAATKDNKSNNNFQLEVEKEKERIRSAAVEEIKVEEAKKAKEIEAMQIMSTSTMVGSSEDETPPYIAPN